MKTLKDLIQDDYLAASGDLTVEIGGITADSRQVRPGTLFVALRGEKFDGNAFVNDAVAAGAAAVVSDAPPPESNDIAWVQVENARRRLPDIARRFYDFPDEKLTLIGITGTNGKTTTAHVLSRVLNQLRGPCGVLSTVDHQLGTRVIPAALTTQEAHENLEMISEMLSSGCRSAVMETSSAGIDRFRVEGFDFDALVFTNFSRDHLEYHGSMEAYFDAKARLFKSYKGKKPVTVLNNDDEKVSRLKGELEIPVYTFGRNTGSDLQLKDISLNEYGSTFEVLWQGQRYEVESRLLGRFNVYNLLAAITTLLALGFEMSAILPHLAEVPPVKGRMEPIPTDTPFRVLVDYAHTDDALLQLLLALKEIAAGRLTVIFGCGGDRDTGKRPLMGAHAMKNADLVVLTSDNPRTESPEAIIDDVLVGINEVEEPRAHLHVEVDRTTAIKWALDQAEPGDVIVLAGKGHEPYQEVDGVKHPYDEPAIVLEHLEKSS